MVKIYSGLEFFYCFPFFLLVFMAPVTLKHATLRVAARILYPKFLVF